MKKDITFLVCKVLIFALLFGLCIWCLKTVDPVIISDIALGQMENSDDWYLMLRMYEMVRKTVSIVLGLLVVLFALVMGRDIHKIINTKKENY